MYKETWDEEKLIETHIIDIFYSPHYVWKL